MNIENNIYFIEIIEWLNKTITIELFVKIVILYFIIIWISIIFWVIRDITERSNSFFLQFFSILLVTIWTPIWIFIYLLLRPTKTLFEKYNDDVEFNLVKLKKIVEKLEKEKKEKPEAKEKEKSNKKEINKKTKDKNQKKKKTKK